MPKIAADIVIVSSCLRRDLKRENFTAALAMASGFRPASGLNFQLSGHLKCMGLKM